MSFKELILQNLYQEAEGNYLYNYGEDYIDEESQDYDNDFPLTQVNDLPLTQVTPADVADVSLEKVHNVVGPDSVGFAAKYASEAIGKAVDAEVAGSMNFLLTNKLCEKIYQAMLDKYDPPSNCPKLCVPKVNPAIWECLQPKTRSTDLKMQRAQRSLVKGLVAFTHDLTEPNEVAQDTLTCLANAVFEMNMLRRELIKPDLNYKYSHLCKPDVQSTEFLFGDDLTKHIKDLSELHKATGTVSRGRASSRGRFHPYASFRGRGAQRGGFLGQYPRRGMHNPRLLFKRRGRGQQVLHPPQ